MKRKYIVIIFCLILLMALWGRLIIRCNEKTPEAEEIKTRMGEWGRLTDDVLIRFKDVKIMTSQQAEGKYGSRLTENVDSDGVDYMTFVVSGEAENTGSKRRDAYLYDLYLENDYYSNGIAQDIQSLLDTPDVTLKLDKNETRDFCIGYIIYKNQFRPAVWKHIKNMDWRLVGEHYPKKRIFELDASAPGNSDKQETAKEDSDAETAAIVKMANGAQYCDEGEWIRVKNLSVRVNRSYFTKKQDGWVDLAEVMPDHEADGTIKGPYTYLVVDLTFKQKKGTDSLGFCSFSAMHYAKDDLHPACITLTSSTYFSDHMTREQREDRDVLLTQINTGKEVHTKVIYTLDDADDIRDDNTYALQVTTTGQMPENDKPNNYRLILLKPEKET